jgi:hypothetical protein
MTPDPSAPLYLLLSIVGIFVIIELFDIFKNELLNEWQNVLFYDKTINSKSKKIINYKNPIYWNELLNKPTKSNYYKHREFLKDLTLNNSDKIQNNLTEIMSKKIDFLNNRGASFDTLIIKSIHTPQQINKDKICIVTGVNISMQKDNSLLLSHTGLKYYYKTDKKIFEQIKRRYLSKRWLTSDIETQIKEIAHNIRNSKSNQKIKQVKIYPQNQYNLIQFLID